MPHPRERYLRPLLQKVLGASPIVGILGQRQTGKTTLTEETAAEYVTLDDEEQLELALKSAKAFLQGRKAPFAIDECQQSAALFPALKEYVRTRKRMGQFILTGSVRFTSIEDIKESLTGRMVALELLPLCLTELHETPLTRPRKLAEAKDPVHFLRERNKRHEYGRKAIEEFLGKGGLPGICFLRSDDLRERKMRSHIRTILDRDLRMVTKTTLDYLTLKTFLEEIALQQGDVFDLARAARGARIAVNSARKILSGLESVYLIRTLAKRGDTAGKIVYFEDQGMASFLLKERGFHVEKLRVSDLNRFLFQQLQAQLGYGENLQADFFSFRLKSGAVIDFVIKTQGVYLGYSLGIGSSASPLQISSAESFRKKHPGARVVLLHLGESIRQIAPNVVEAPIGVVV